jgi:hypothetical protein
MTAKIYRFPRPTPLHPEITFLGSIALLAALATLLSIVAPWS